MLSNNRWFGAHARVWNHGSVNACLAPGFPLWLAVATAAKMEKTAAAPAGYGASAHAPPQMAGAWASYQRARFELGSSANADAGYVSAASASFTLDATASAIGIGVAVGSGSFVLGATAAASAEAIAGGSATFGFSAVANAEATAPFEGTASFGFDASVSATAEAIWIGTAPFTIDASCSSDGGGYVWSGSANVTVSASMSSPLGQGVWAGSTEGNELAMTPEGIATATVQALQTAVVPVNVVKMNSAPVVGTGQSNDKWRGA